MEQEAEIGKHVKILFLQALPNNSERLQTIIKNFIFRNIYTERK